MSNTNFHLSPIILFDQPTLEDHQNLAFHGHASGSNIRKKEQRISSNNIIEIKKYGWDTNSGYGTKEHLRAIKKYGVTKYHRKTFSPISEYK